MTEEKKQNCAECESEDSYHFDPFSFGNLLDEHIDTEVEEDTVAKRISAAIEMSRKLGGKLAGGVEDELDELIKPKLTWQDFIRFAKGRKKEVEKRNDWLTPRRKPLFYGMFVPKKIDYTVKFLLAYDCSGSMSKEQISYGISQVGALDEKGEGFCLPWDSEPFFDAMVEIKNASKSELRNAKYKGGGGTVLSPVFKQYEKQIGKVDIIIIVSDFYIADLEEVSKLSQPEKTEVVWLSVNGNPKFTPPFGRMFRLMND